ncbi:MAG: hypothetical protein L0Y72_19405 [Gemmataceae bacterium]|nr:hypothetical protein [Gemmataceae bacterium]
MECGAFPPLLFFDWPSQDQLSQAPKAGSASVNDTVLSPFLGFGFGYWQIPGSHPWLMAVAPLGLCAEEFLVERFLVARPIHIGVDVRPNEQQERTQIALQRLLPRAVENIGGL